MLGLLPSFLPSFLGSHDEKDHIVDVRVRSVRKGGGNSLANQKRSIS